MVGVIMPFSTVKGSSSTAKRRTFSSGERFAFTRSTTWASAARKVLSSRKAARSRDLALLRHRSEEHTSELQSLMRISYAVFCLTKKKKTDTYCTSRTRYRYVKYQ